LSSSFAPGVPLAPIEEIDAVLLEAATLCSSLEHVLI
jgi:hypothetical protein